MLDLKTECLKIEDLPKDMICEITKNIYGIKGKINFTHTCKFFKDSVNDINKHIISHLESLSIHSVFALCMRNEIIAKLVLSSCPHLLGRHDQEKSCAFSEMNIYPYKYHVDHRFTGEYLFKVCKRFESTKSISKESDKIKSMLSNNHVDRINEDKIKYIRRCLYI